MTIRFLLSMTIAALIGGWSLSTWPRSRDRSCGSSADVFALQVTPLGINRTGWRDVVHRCERQCDRPHRFGSPPSFSSYITVPTPATAAVSIAAGPAGISGSRRARAIGSAGSIKRRGRS